MGRGVLEFGPFVRETSLEKIKSEWTESEELAHTRLIVPPTALQMAKEGVSPTLTSVRGWDYKVGISLPKTQGFMMAYAGCSVNSNRKGT